MRSVLVPRAASACLVLLCAATAADAAILNASGAAAARSASVRFENIGGNLVVTLTNTAAADTFAVTDVLSGVCFDIAGAPLTLTRLSAGIAPGSSVSGIAMPATGVGGEWAYRSGLGRSLLLGDHGLGSMSLGQFKDADRFSGSHLAGINDPSVAEFGLAAAGDDPATHASHTAFPLISSSVVLVLGGLPDGFEPDDCIRNVVFQYGNGSSRFNLRVPAPGSGVLLLCGLGLLGSRRRSA